MNIVHCTIIHTMLLYFRLLKVGVGIALSLLNGKRSPLDYE